jgi:hypothetical protein
MMLRQKGIEPDGYTVKKASDEQNEQKATLSGWHPNLFFAEKFHAEGYSL